MAASPGDAAMERSVGCQHYQRGCQLRAPCCGKFYICRLCHDDKEDHELDRFKVKEVQCAKCKQIQPVLFHSLSLEGTKSIGKSSVQLFLHPNFTKEVETQQVCEGCSNLFGEYYCDVCHLFDKDKKQYHCEQCGICRIGPKEHFFHCTVCNLCLAVNLRGVHKCIENVSRQNCPICMEDIHTSRVGAHVLPCGHLLHRTCYEEMLKGGYRCPICMHSALDMSSYWEELDQEVAQTPMPPEYQNMTVEILCNDCCARSTVPFHILGMKCTNCASYNTAQDGKTNVQQQPH